MRRVLLAALLAVTVVAGLVAVVLVDHERSDRASTQPGTLPVTQPPVAPARQQALYVPACGVGSVVRFDPTRAAHAVTVRTIATAFRAPGGRAFARFGRINVNGVPTVFSVIGARLDRRCRASWYHVQLPLRPNGVTGWVRASAVTERALHIRIVVDLSERRVTVYRDSAPVVVTTAAIGSPSTPTPTGHFYVNQKLLPADSLGPFGPAALGISAFSPVLQHWAQGGPIAIHGTNQAELLGSAVSHGCIRVSNDVVERLWKLVPTGTPVLIRM